MDNKDFMEPEENRNPMGEYNKNNRLLRGDTSRTSRNSKNQEASANYDEPGQKRRNGRERRPKEAMRSSSYSNRDNPWVRESARRVNRSQAGKRKRGVVGAVVSLVVFIMLFAGIVVAGYMIIERATPEPPSEEMANFNRYFGLQSAGDLAVIIDSVVISGETTGTGGRIFDGEVYLDLSIVNRMFNGRFYWDNNEQLLIHTLPYGSIVASPDTPNYTDHGESKNESFDIIRLDRGNVFIALPFVQRFANIEYTLYEEPSRLVVTTQWGERTVTTIRRDTYVRTLGGPMAPVLREVSRGEEVFFIEEEGDWRKIATFDGFIGYVRDNTIGDIRTETFNRAFEEPVFTRIVREGPLNVGWDQTNSIYDNARIHDTLSRSQGLTVIAPMWLSIADINGNIDSIGTVEYVQAAHNAGVEVWVTLRDFHGGISSYNETYQVLSRTSSRRQIIDQTIAETLRLSADGINLDLELVPFEAGGHFVQFVREMSVESRSNGLVLSVANFYPLEWRLFMNLSEQARVVDYIMLMGYDQHYEGGRTAGPVASFEFVRDGIQMSLQQVPADMLINALPFYSRLWYEVPMTQEEIATADGRTTHLSSVALGMDMSRAVMDNSGVEVTWDPITRMYYAQWEDPEGTFRWWLENSGAHTGALLPPQGGTYRMWLECERSLREKLQVMRDFNLAGVAAWRLGLESLATWELIGEFY